MGSLISKILPIFNDNLETFSLVWLDAQVNTTEDNRNTQRKLREIINHLKTFDDENLCHQYILSLSPEDRLVLIISGRCGRQLVPQIHHLPQLSSIYVYCMDKQANEQWAKHFTKVKSVIIRLNDLINQIKQDQKNRMRIEEPLSINIFTVSHNPDQSTTELNGHFVHSLLLIDVLIRVRSNETDKRQLITLCKNRYLDNDKELALINEFEREYSSNRAVWWYTRDSFLYKILNKALRVQNIELLFLLRFVIADIYQQLKQNQCSSLVHVYRGQFMSTDELNKLQTSINKFISINSFFSTSLDRNSALEFLNRENISIDSHRVLFDIDADSHIVTSKPFAQINSMSNFANECEVLFMMGCIFQVTDIHQDNNQQIWVIRMKLCGDNEHDLKKLFDYMKEEYGGGDNEINLRFLGNALREMGKYDLAEKMLRRLLDELSPDDLSRCPLYYTLGLVSRDKGEYDSSLQWFDKSFKVQMQLDPSNYVSISDRYICMGEVHWRKGDHKKALEYFNKAIALFQQAQDHNHPNMACLYNNIALIFDDEKKYSEALEYYRKSVAITEKHLPSDHPDIATTWNNIGCVYLKQGQYDLAIQYHEQSLNIRLKSLPSQHQDIARSYANVGAVYEKKNEWKQALVQYRKAAAIFRDTLLTQHPDVKNIEKDIERISSKLS